MAPMESFNDVLETYMVDLARDGSTCRGDVSDRTSHSSFASYKVLQELFKFTLANQILPYAIIVPLQ